MKTLFSSKTLIALAVAVAAAAAYETEANEQPIPPPSNDSVGVLPDGVALGSPVAQVVKLVQAGVDVAVIQTYISNCPSAFNLDADKIIALTDAGLPSDLVNAMFAHDKNFISALSTAAPPSSNPPPATETATTAPPEASPPPPAPPQEVTVNYFNENLSPYGSWVQVDGYGRCWRPNIVTYDSNWRPYCDRGRWVYTDCGWYWQSDYSWGATFHYGRWFNSPRHGWCWWPDTVWAPSWVTWRSCNDYCGWAPLPPYTVYQPGVGFSYHGNNVAVSFGFGLASDCFTFVNFGNFCQPHPRQYCLPGQHVAQIYGQTTVINNFGCNNNHCFQNNGVSVTVIGNAARRPIPAVPIGSLVNPGHRGWGGNMPGPGRHFGADTSSGSGNQNFSGTEFRHGPANQNNGDRNNNDARSGSGFVANHNPSFKTTFEPASTPSARNNLPIVTQNSPASPTVNSPSRPPRQNDNSLVTRGPGLAPRPVQNPVRNTWVANDNRQNSQPVRVVAAPPVVSNDHPQHSAPRQNFNQTATRNFTPAAPVASSPVQSQPQQNGNGFGGGRIQGWMAQNR